MIKHFPFFAFILSFVLFGPTRVAFSEATKNNVGILAPFTGPYADLGRDCRQGVEVALAARGGKVNATLIYEDTQADSKLTTIAAKKLAADPNLVALLVSRSGPGLAANPISRQHKIPLFGAVAHPQFPKQNKFAFQFWSTTTEEGKHLAEHLISKGQKKVALLTTEDDWLLSLTGEFVKAYKARGGSVVFQETIVPSDSDFSTLIAKIKVASPDAVFLNISIAQLVVAVKRVREQQVAAGLYSNFFLGSEEVMAGLGPEGLEGLSFFEVNLNLPKFLEVLKPIAGEELPTSKTFSCYTSMAMIFQVLDTLGADTSAEKLYEALLKTETIELLDKPLTVKDRIAQFDLVLKTFRDGKLQIQ